MTNKYSKISLRIMLLAMAFCVPIQANGFVSRAGKQIASCALSALKQPHGFAQAAIRNGVARGYAGLPNGVAKPRFNNGANFGKAALVAGGLAGAIGADQVLAQEEPTSQKKVRPLRNVSGFEHYWKTLTLEYDSGEKEVCDLTDQEQFKKVWMEGQERLLCAKFPSCRSLSSNPWVLKGEPDWTSACIMQCIEKNGPKEWIEKLRKEFREQFDVQPLTQEQVTQWKQAIIRERELAQRERELEWNPERELKEKQEHEKELLRLIVKKMVDRAQKEKEERERQEKFLGLNSSELKIAGVMAVGVGLMGAGIWGHLNVPVQPKPVPAFEPQQLQQLQQSPQQGLPVSYPATNTPQHPQPQQASQKQASPKQMDESAKPKPSEVDAMD